MPDSTRRCSPACVCWCCMACVTIALIIAIPLCYKACSGTTRPSAEAELWIWQIVSPPTEEGDGFAHLTGALAYLEAATAGDKNAMARCVDEVIDASNSRSFSGRLIDVDPRAIGGGAGGWSGAGNGFVRCADILAILRTMQDAAAQRLEAGDTAGARDVADAAILLGYQLGRNSESVTEKVYRVAAWQVGLRLHRQIAVARDDRAEVARLSAFTDDLFAEFGREEEEP
ncbi:MAG: hypothetical protein KAS72_02890 [Phycisphaerales bacterium]|nr:hypothetical protein [Phycisphaerales bacterium]